MFAPLRLLFLILLSVIFYSTSHAQSDSIPEPSPDTVKVGAYVISVHDINFHEKEYTIRFWLWFLYKNAGFDFSKQLDIPNAKTIEPPEIIVDSLDERHGLL
jgi:hypothetical protein